MNSVDNQLTQEQAKKEFEFFALSMPELPIGSDYATYGLNCMFYGFVEGLRYSGKMK